MGLLALFGSALGLGKPTPAKTKPIHITIQGLGGKALDNTKARLDESTTGLDGDYTQRSIYRFYRHLRQDVRSAIEPYGYFKAKIHTQIDYDYSKNIWQINVKVDHGPQLKFTTLDLQITGAGANDPAYQRIIKNFPVKVGQPFHSAEYQSAREDLFDIAANNGYFDNKMVQNQLIVNLNTYTSTVIMHFDTGPRFYFGPSTFNKTPFKESFLRRFLNYKQGQPYLARTLDLTREGFANSAYFQQVLAVPKISDTKLRQVPINYTLTPQAQRQYTFGAGYGTDTGPRAVIATTFNWINSYGHRFDALIRGSQISNELAAHYYIPGTHPARDQYVISGGLAREDFATGNSKSASLSAAYQTIIAGWQISPSLNYLDEKSNYPTLPGSPTVNANLVYPNLSIQRRVADDQLNPSKGYGIVLNLAGANSSFLSKISFMQARLTLKGMYTFWDRLRFVVRGTSGITDINQVQNLPLTLQFYAGGAESIRGYSFAQFGPGRYLFTGTFETQVRVKGNFYVVGFIDAGNATNDFAWNQIHAGTGPGIAYASPVGLLELTVANAITSPGHPWVIQFSMGPPL